jgi:hypothetical protein
VSDIFDAWSIKCSNKVEFLCKGSPLNLQTFCKHSLIQDYRRFEVTEKLNRYVCSDWQIASHAKCLCGTEEQVVLNAQAATAPAAAPAPAAT